MKINYFRVEYANSQGKWFPAYPGKLFDSKQIGPAVRKARNKWRHVRSRKVER